MKKRNLINSMRINTISRSINRNPIRSAVCTFISQIDPTIQECSDISTAVGEAIENIVNFAYENEFGKIQIDISIFEGNHVRIKVRDWGCGIENVEEAVTSFYSTVEEKAGLGFTVMDTFMDSVKVYSIVGKGTTVVMEKICCGKKS